MRLGISEPRPYVNRDVHYSLRAGSGQHPSTSLPDLRIGERQQTLWPRVRRREGAGCR